MDPSRGEGRFLKTVLRVNLFSASNALGLPTDVAHLIRNMIDRTKVTNRFHRAIFLFVRSLLGFVGEDDIRKTQNAPVDNEEIDSDEEVPSNTIGSNVPLKWYENHDHIGYDFDAKKIAKPVSAGKSDEIDEFLEKMENADYWRTVYDDLTGQNVTLTNEDIATIQQIQNAGTYPGDHVYEPWQDTFSAEVMIHPILNTPESKASFIPSKWERLKVGKYLNAIKMGWIKPAPPKEDPFLSNNYDLWSDEPKTNLPRSNIPAPKLELPGHHESYNPSYEYLLDDAEVAALKNKMESDFDENERDTKTLFVPKKYPSLRQVPAYDQFIYERFQRCLDLYLCPRQKRLKANVTDLNDLIPDKPKPQDLHPYPLVQSLIYEGHKNIIRCLACHISGQWLASGSDDCTVRIWEIATTRCMNVFTFEKPVVSIQWNSVLSLLAVVTGSQIVMINPKLGENAKVAFTDEFIKQLTYESSSNDDCQWTKTSEEADKYIRLTITHSMPIRQIEWQGRGDYLACVSVPRSDQSQSKSICIHHISKGRSQYPFKQLKGAVQHVRFHPTKPIFIVATQHSIKIYHLLKQQLIKRLYVNTKWISSIDVHPMGDNVLCGGYDSKINWFDLDLSVKPYETYRYHKRAIRCVRYHTKLPLFASTSDDGTCIISHCSVYSDLLKNPMIVPVKILRGHQTTNDLSILDCLFHPTQPWIFTSGADSTIRLFTN